MRSYWILPNRAQGNEVLASDGLKTVPLREILSPALRPAGFSHGVPTEILEKCDPGSFSKILFGQIFPRWNGEQRLVSISTAAGVDSAGRVVHLGLLYFLGAHERPTFDVPMAGLPGDDVKNAADLLRRLSADRQEDPWVRSIHDLIQSAPELGPTTNIELDRSVTRLASLYTLGPKGLRRKRGQRGSHTAAFVLLIAVAILLTFLGVRGARCSGALAGPGGQAGHVREDSVGRPPHADREW